VHHLQERAQYLHQFMMHAALDAVDEQLWSTSAMHLASCMGVVDRFDNLQAKLGRRLHPHQMHPFLSSEPAIVILVAACSYIHHRVVPPACAHMFFMSSVSC
jgi:Sedlin, N-terminal conserved region